MVLGHSNFFITSEKTIQYHSILVSLHFQHLGFSTVAKIYLDLGQLQIIEATKEHGGNSFQSKHRTRRADQE